MSEVGTRLAQLSADERALLLEKLLRRRKEQDTGEERLTIPRRAESAPAPLSFGQQRLWFLDRLSPGDVSYNIPIPVIIDGPLKARVLERALAVLLDRHESLRTTFSRGGDAPVQIVAPRLEMPFPVADLSIVEDPRHPEVERASQQLIELPFDLAAGPLLRALLLRLEPERHVLVLVIHHIVTDGWSMGVLINDLATFAQAMLRGEDPAAALPPLPIQYADFAVWQRDWLQGERLEEQVAVWRKRLAGLPTALPLPTDRPRPPVKSSAGAPAFFRLGVELGSRLQAAAREEGVTPFMILLAAYEVLLSRWSGQEAFAVGSAVANRNRPELEKLIGFFANTLALRADVTGSPTIRELLARVRDVTLEAFSHQDIPFEKLVEELRPERDPSRSPIFQVSLSLQNTPRPKVALGGIALTGLEIPLRRARFDLEAAFDDSRDGNFLGTFAYSTALFDAGTVERLIGHFRRLLEAVLEDRTRPISDLPLLTPGEIRQLESWNRTDIPGPAVPPEVLFADLAAAAPEAPVVVSAAGMLTRGKLEAQANRLARRLRRLGVGLEVPVAVLLPRSPELILAALAVARAGGAYMPIDPAYPPERIAAVLGDAAAPVVLTQGGLADRLPSAGRTVLLLDGDDPAIETEEDAEPVESSWSSDPDGLAYVIYTSGSTGRPKGVGCRRDAFAHLIAWTLRALPPAPGDRATLIAGPAFDGAVWELWSSLCSGAAIHIPDEETRLSPPRLASWMARERIRTSFLPTPLAEALLAEPAASDLPLRTLMTGGDRLHRVTRGDLPFRIVNCYGPSEATVITSCALDAAREPGDRDPSVGPPIDNARVWVLDAALRPLPVGVPGELWVGGGILARGYLGRPDLTAAAFRPDPFAKVPGARLYRTGDLARWRSEGTLEVLGRVDGQVKIRGFRVETGEIEAVLAEHPAVSQVVVTPRDGATGRILVAYLVCGTATNDELRLFLRNRLPEFMIPTSFVRLPALPLTPGGKVDHAALGRIEPELNLPAETKGPRSETERTLAAIWAEILVIDQIGVDQSFFDLGGHSLLLTQLQTRITAALGREVPLMKLIEHPTVASFAAWLDEGDTVPVGDASRDRAHRQRQALDLQRQRLTRRVTIR